MAKISFDIKFRPQIESGEYKLETECGHPVSIMDWEWIDRDENKCLAVKVLMDEGFNMGYLFNYDGKRNSIFPTGSDSDLFIITPEPELSEFELKLLDWLSSDTSGEIPMEKMKKCVKNRAAEFLELAKKEIEEELKEKVLNDYWKQAADDCVRARIESKAETLKDLPRWRKWGNGVCGNGQGIPLAIVKRGLNDYKLVDALGIQGEQYIMLSELEKLPKED